MRIVQAHKYYWWKDGATNYALYLTKLLQSAGQEVVPFAMKHPKNLKTPYSKYFVSNMELGDPKSIGLKNRLLFTSRMFYSLEAKRNFRAFLAREHFDMVHIHNIYHHISPSILPVIKKQGIPIVMTLHDYKLIGPNYALFHHGKVHDDDRDWWYLKCIKNRCMKDSLAQSTVVSLEMIFHHKIMRYYERFIDRFIAPSEFIMRKCIDAGFSKEKFVHIPHPVDTSLFTYVGAKGDYVAYVGRLSEEKGLDILLDAAKLTPDISYKIVGTGPQEAFLRARVKQESIVNVTCVGFKTGAALTQLLANARLMVVPSVWYENYPLSILEPKSMGKIVVGSAIGGIPEQLPEDMLVPPRDPESLAKCITRWYSASEKIREKRGSALRKSVDRINDPQKHVERILRLYRSLCA